MIGFFRRTGVILGALVCTVVMADAADLNVYSSIGVQGALEALVPEFQKQSGDILALTWGTAAMLTKRVDAGEPADVVILTRANVDALSGSGKIAPGSDATLAQSSIAIAVKTGAAKPDISTSDALKAALLQAKSIAYSNPASGGASGVYFAQLLERLGITGEMKAKTKFPPHGGNSATLLLDGEAELAVQQKPELMAVSGVDIVGLLPAELNKVTAFVAAVTANSTHKDAAQALVKYLQSPDAAKVFKAAGFDSQ